MTPLVFLALVLVGINGATVNIVNDVNPCPARTYTGTISLFVNSAQRILSKGQSYLVTESDVPQMTGIGIQENGFYCRNGGNTPGNGCINPDNAGMQLWLDGPSCQNYRLVDPFYCGANPPNAKNFVKLTMTGTWPSCIATLSRLSTAPDCIPNGQTCPDPQAPTSTPGVAPPSQGYLQSVSNGKYAVVGTGQVAAATASTTSSATQFSFAPITGGYTIRSVPSQQYASATNWGNDPIIVNRPTASGWETFAFQKVGNSWAIQATVNGKYVAVQSNSNLLPNSASSSANTALFNIVSSGGSNPTPTSAPTNPPSAPTTSTNIATATSVILYSVSANSYVVVGENGILTASSQASGATRFRPVALNGGYALQNIGSSQYTAAENGGTSPLVANRPTASGWETFNFLAQSGRYALQAQANNQLVAVQSNQQLLANIANASPIPNSALYVVVAA